MSDDLTTISGIGAESATDLEDAGFDTVEAVAEATVDELTEADGFGEARASDTIDAATDHLDTIDDEADDTVDEETAPAVDEDEADEPPTPDRYECAFTCKRMELNHIIHVVLDEATRQHQSSQHSLRNDAYEVSDRLMNEIVALDDGVDYSDEIDVTVDLTSNELNAFSRALSQGSMNYASRTGITGMYGTLERISDVVTDARQRGMHN